MEVFLLRTPSQLLDRDISRDFSTTKHNVLVPITGTIIFIMLVSSG